MKLFIIIALIFSAYSCKISKQEKSILTDPEWNDALSVSGSFSGLNREDTYLFNFYENIEFAEEISSVYLKGSKVFDYQIKDSIINYIHTRGNTLITNHIDTAINIKFIADTVNNITKRYILLSEPFYLDKELICFLLAIKNSSNLNGHWIFFFKKDSKSLETLGLYDLQKKMFFKASKL